ncbi:type 2 phosphatidylinositol 4,5-bisphosphate 4-phosphatase-like [Acropora muricata]|uniref:type 2 phosphatidylinositol 4,5-bisphosphate 4-phosphatase-like n=2 Tax=Acropora TaxID=6127 RepID=UPI001CF4CCE7|nr:type 2 phosphatidylinositol 4,5-bisphosphate 4-phosphatase-like [Acropora millepora]
MADAEESHIVTSPPMEPDSSESAPLLQEQENQNEDPGPPPPFVANGPPPVPGTPPPAYSEMPPLYPAYAPISTEPSVICRVCQQLIYIRGREHQRVVKCSNCQEATPIKPPPAGKKYIRCPCNALLTCKVSSQRISCPRVNCKKIINLAPAPVSPIAGVPPLQRAQFRVTCGHCNEIFVFHTTSHLARCPHCRRISSVGHHFARMRAMIFAIIGFIFLAAGVGVTVGTLDLARHTGGIYVVWIGAFVAGILNLIRSCYYCTMTVSSIEGQP